MSTFGGWTASWRGWCHARTIGHTGIVNDHRPVVLARGKDRKLYPAQMPPDEAEQRRARVMAHNLVCRDRLSYRAALDAMLGYGLRRSLGWLAKTIAGFDCGPRCTGRPAEPSTQPAGQQQPQATVHQAGLSGGLTDMIERDGR